VFIYAYVKPKTEKYVLFFIWEIDLLKSNTGRTVCLYLYTVSKRSYMHSKYDIS